MSEKASTEATTPHDDEPLVEGKLLPLSFPEFQALIASLKKEVLDLHTSEVQDYVTRKGGVEALQNSTKVHLTNGNGDPFTFLTSLTSVTLPKFPPIEYTYAANMNTPQKADDDPKSSSSDQKSEFLTLTLQEMDSVTFCDAVMYKFALTRKYDLPSAAKRFLHFRKLVLENGLVFGLDDDIRAGLGLGVFHFPPPVHVLATGAVLVAGACRYCVPAQASSK